MIRGIEAITLSTSKDNFDKLVKFYHETVGLQIENEAEMGEDDQFTALKIGDGNLYIISHSDIHGESHEPARTMINIEVDDIEKETQRLKDAGAKEVEPVYHVEGYGYIATFADSDGNYFQLVQVRES